MPLVTASAYKTSRNITGSTLDDQIGEGLLFAQAAFERHCDRLFDYSDSHTEYISGDGSPFLRVKAWPIASVTSISLRDDSDNYTTYDATGYRASATRNVIERLPKGRVGRFTRDAWGNQLNSGSGWSSYWPEGVENIRVIYAGGYGGDGPDAPVELVEDIYWSIDRHISRLVRDEALQSEAHGAENRTYRPQIELQQGWLDRANKWRGGV